MELLGEMPKSLALSGKYSHDMFNRRGELRHIQRLRFWPLLSVLKEKYLMEAEEAELLTSFLLPMLHYYPDSRATAAELLKHPWLEGVVVQGDLEIAKQNHEREVERLVALQSGTPAGAAGAAPANNGANNGTDKGKSKDSTSALEEILKLGKPVAGMVGMGRV
jgi:serine/threonine-protein kinase SRPK3